MRAELGRFPVENFINSQAILYLARLHTDNLNPLLKEAFELSKSLDSQHRHLFHSKNICPLLFHTVRKRRGHIFFE